jgi:integrase
MKAAQPQPSNAADTVSAIEAKWRAERGAHWAESTRQEFATALRLFKEAVGDKPIREVTRGDVRDFKDLLLTLPVSAARKFKGMKIREAVALAEQQPELRRLARASVNKYLTALSSLFEWAVLNAYADMNPAHKLRVGLDKRADEQRLPFSVDDLNTIFTSPLYAAGKPDPAHPERWWIPLLAVFSGARLDELCQLLETDVVERDGVPMIRITDEGGKALKAKSSRRDIPIHPTLIALGFLDYVASVRKSGEKKLWPSLAKNARGSWSQNFSKWFGRWKVELSIKDKKKVFHSFRHNVADRLRNADIELELRNALLGHSQGAMGARYGEGFKPKVLLAALQRVEYPGVNLPKAQHE